MTADFQSDKNGFTFGYLVVWLTYRLMNQVVSDSIPDLDKISIKLVELQPYLEVIMNK